MTDVELIQYIKKILGKYAKDEGILVWGIDDYGDKHKIKVDSEGRIVISGNVTTQQGVYTDHLIKRFSVNETEQEFDLGKTAYVLYLRVEDAPIYVNLDRSITSDEYFDLWPEEEKLITRETSKIYAKVPSGYGSGNLIVEALTIA